MSKSLFKSKTFWTNVVAGAVAVASGHLGFTVPATYAVPIVAIGNIVLRLLTKEPVHVVT